MCVIASQCATSPDGGGHANFVDTSVCRIVANPQNFDGKVVRFTADFESDGIERSVLVDPACSNQGIAPYDPQCFRETGVSRHEISLPGGTCSRDPLKMSSTRCGPRLLGGLILLVAGRMHETFGDSRHPPLQA